MCCIFCKKSPPISISRLQAEKTASVSNIKNHLLIVTRESPKTRRNKERQNYYSTIRIVQRIIEEGGKTFWRTSFNWDKVGRIFWQLKIYLQESNGKQITKRRKQISKWNIFHQFSKKIGLRIDKFSTHVLGWKTSKYVDFLSSGAFF